LNLHLSYNQQLATKMMYMNSPECISTQWTEEDVYWQHWDSNSLRIGFMMLHTHTEHTDISVSVKQAYLD